MNLSLIFLVASAVCFVVCLLLAVGTFNGSNFDAWLAGGLLAFVLSFLAGAVTIPARS